jgi:drug efflux transport system ATP-binding protein
VPEPAVVVRDLVKRFGAFTAVDRLSFEIERGEIFGFLGPNGSGKSTTIRMLCGLLLPTEGQAFVNGINVRERPEEVRAVIGYMSQLFSLYGDLTVEENLEFYGGVYGVTGHALRQRVDALLERLDLGDERDRLTEALSTGVRQRVALACALVHDPPILFLDEPTSGVDPVARRNFFELVGELSARGVTTLITTHVMDEAEHCSRLVLIYEGRRVALGKPDELKALVPGRLLQVRAQPNMRAAEALVATAGVLNVSLFGTALHVAVAEEAGSPEELIRRALPADAFRIEEIAPVRVTLEHAFLHLTSGADTEAAA